MGKQNNKNLAVLALVVASVISGVNSPVVHYGLQTIPVALFGLLRHAIPLALLALFLLIRPRTSLSGGQITTAVCFGFLIYFASNGLFYLGVQRSGSVNSAVIGLLEPLLMFVVSVEVMKEKFNGRVFTGIALAFVGSLLVVFGPLLFGQGLSFAGSLLGNLFLLACVFTSIAGTWVAKLGLKKIDRVQFLFWSLVPAVFLYGILSLGQVSLLPSIIRQPSLVYAVLFGAIMNGLLTYLCIFYGLKRVNGEEYGLFSYIAPATAAFVAVVFFNEKFTPLLVAGVSIIAAGLYLAEAHHSRAWHHKFRFLSRN